MRREVGDRLFKSTLPGSQIHWGLKLQPSNRSNDTNDGMIRDALISNHLDNPSTLRKLLVPELDARRPCVSHVIAAPTLKACGCGWHPPIGSASCTSGWHNGNPAAPPEIPAPAPAPGQALCLQWRGGTSAAGTRRA